MAALVELKDLAEVLRATSECLKGLADSIAHVVGLSAAGYDAVAARRQRAALLEIRAQLLGLGRAQGIGMTALDTYRMRVSAGRRPGTLATEWERVMRGLEDCLGKARAVLGEIRELRGDFFLEEDYELLMQALGARISLFQRLLQQDPPASEEELELLREASAEWRKLFRQLMAASEALRQFLLHGDEKGGG